MNNENFTQDTVLDIITDFPIDPLRNKVVITLNKEEIDGDLVLSDNVMSEVQYVIAGEVIYRDKVVKPGQKVLLDIKGMMKSVRREVTFEVGLRITYKIERTIEKIIKSILPQKSNHLKILNNKESEGLANLHQLNALLIGFHIILKKRSEVYSEDRSTIRLRYDDINELINIENKYLLIKKESQAGNLKNEINFSINFKKVNQILEDLKPNKFVKIIYADETATQKINHPYFSNKFWTNEFETKSIISFLRNGLSTYLLMLTKQVDIKDEKGFVREMYLGEMISSLKVPNEGYNYNQEGELIEDKNPEKKFLRMNYLVSIKHISFAFKIYEYTEKI